jgi:CBS domain containing-hemolysin-like protein
VDERGTMVGLAFREDALEEIVGALGDEFDEQTPTLQQLGPGQFELRGRMALPEVCNRLDITLDDQEEEGQDTIGGYVTARLRRLARTGDRVTVGPYEATVLEASRRQIQRLRLERCETDDETAATEAP